MCCHMCQGFILSHWQDRAPPLPGGRGGLGAAFWSHTARVRSPPPCSCDFFFAERERRPRQLALAEESLGTEGYCSRIIGGESVLGQDAGRAGRRDGYIALPGSERRCTGPLAQQPRHGSSAVLQIVEYRTRGWAFGNPCERSRWDAARCFYIMGLRVSAWGALPFSHHSVFRCGSTSTSNYTMGPRGPELPRYCPGQRLGTQWVRLLAEWCFALNEARHPAHLRRSGQLAGRTRPDTAASCATVTASDPPRA